LLVIPVWIVAAVVHRACHRVEVEPDVVIIAACETSPPEPRGVVFHAQRKCSLRGAALAEVLYPDLFVAEHLAVVILSDRDFRVCDPKVLSQRGHGIDGEFGGDADFCACFDTVVLLVYAGHGVVHKSPPLIVIEACHFSLIHEAGVVGCHPSRHCR